MGKRLTADDVVLIKKIAVRLKELRKAKGISQRQFYYDTSIRADKAESGKKNFEITTLETICRYYNISLGEFFNGIKSQEEPNSGRTP